ncbi:MAG: hypothetical protein ACYC08_08600, partial [Armatimonadota bacterium]
WRHDPNSPTLMLALAGVYEKEGREAIHIYRRMAKVEGSLYERVRAIPELVESAYIFAHAAIGESLEEQGDLPGAVREYETALARISRYQESMRAMGAIIEAGGQGNPEMEERVEEAEFTLTERLHSLRKRSGGSGR